MSHAPAVQKSQAGYVYRKKKIFHYEALPKKARNRTKRKLSIYFEHQVLVEKV